MGSGTDQGNTEAYEAAFRASLPARLPQRGQGMPGLIPPRALEQPGKLLWRPKSVPTLRPPVGGAGERASTPPPSAQCRRSQAAAANTTPTLGPPGASGPAGTLMLKRIISQSGMNDSFIPSLVHSPGPPARLPPAMPPAAGLGLSSTGSTAPDFTAAITSATAAAALPSAGAAPAACAAPSANAAAGARTVLSRDSSTVRRLQRWVKQARWLERLENRHDGQP